MTDHPAANSEVASVTAKMAVVWAGTLFGIQLSDIVLLATLCYTVLQIGILIWEKIVKPLKALNDLRVVPSKISVDPSDKD